jgi:hypothetical protein
LVDARLCGGVHGGLGHREERPRRRRGGQESRGGTRRRRHKGEGEIEALHDRREVNSEHAVVVTTTTTTSIAVLGYLVVAGGGCRSGYLGRPTRVALAEDMAVPDSRIEETEIEAVRAVPVVGEDGVLLTGEGEIGGAKGHELAAVSGHEGRACLAVHVNGGDGDTAGYQPRDHRRAETVGRLEGKGEEGGGQGAEWEGASAPSLSRSTHPGHDGGMTAIET